MTWGEVTFEEIYAEPSRNGIYKSKEHHGSGAKIVNMGELFGHDVIAEQEMKRLAMSDAEMQKAGLADGDLLFGRRSLIEAGAGKCTLVEGLSEPTTFESSIIRVRVRRERANPRFLFYWFKSPIGRGRVFSIVSGTNVKGIRGSDLKNIKVVLPPLPEQERIVEIVKNYDDLIDNNRRRIALLEEMARLLYREWFVHCRFPGHEHVKIVDGVPEGWTSTPMVELVEMVMGQSPKSEFYNSHGEGLPFHQGVTNYGFRFVTNVTYSTNITKLAEADDILFSVRAPVGRINITLNRMVLGRGLAAFRSKSGNQSFLFYQLKSHFFKEDLIGGGAIYAATNKKELEKIELLQPTDDLIQSFEQFSKPIDEQIRALTLKTDQLIKARDLLLPRLMDGRLEV